MSSLNRKEWEEMWWEIKRIELYAKELRGERRFMILAEVKNIKEKIQSVIGQME